LPGCRGRGPGEASRRTARVKKPPRLTEASGGWVGERLYTQECVRLGGSLLLWQRCREG